MYFFFFFISKLKFFLNYVILINNEIIKINNFRYPIVMKAWIIFLLKISHYMFLNEFRRQQFRCPFGEITLCRKIAVSHFME